jgi:hypothetical protein
LPEIRELLAPVREHTVPDREIPGPIQEHARRLERAAIRVQAAFRSKSARWKYVVLG